MCNLYSARKLGSFKTSCILNRSVLSKFMCVYSEVFLLRRGRCVLQA